ncbi:hypothetical protein CBL_13447 [Carabus blaptoides fortunei]
MSMLLMRKKSNKVTTSDLIRERICKTKRAESRRKPCKIVAAGMGKPKDPKDKKDKKNKKNKGNKPKPKSAERKSTRLQSKAKTMPQKINNPEGDSAGKNKKPKATKKPRKTGSKREVNQAKA